MTRSRKGHACRSPSHLEHQDAWTNSLTALKRAGLRHTRPREILLKFLSKDHGPHSPQEIVSRLSSKGMDGVTIYRSLALFEEMRLVRRCDFGDGVARFEFLPDPSKHHHHVICVRCRKAEELGDCRIPKLEKQVGDLGYSDVSHALEFFGVCRDCRI